MPRPYPPEFRQRALDLVRSGCPVAEVAALLGIAESCLYRWKRQDLIDSGLKPGTAELIEKLASMARPARHSPARYRPTATAGRSPGHALATTTSQALWASRSPRP